MIKMSTVFKVVVVTHSPRTGLWAQQVLFPIAAVFAAVAPWLLLVSLSGKFGLIVDVPTHARGMLFGFVGALMAGYLVGKQRRNRLIAPLLVLISCFPLIYWLQSAFEFPVTVSFYGLILQIALLMFFMGGRSITPVLARAVAEHGQKLRHRVQPRLEGSVMVLMLFASGLTVLLAPYQWVAPRPPVFMSSPSVHSVRCLPP